MGFMLARFANITTEKWYLNKTELEPEIPVRLETDSEIQMSDELFDFIIEEG